MVDTKQAKRDIHKKNTTNRNSTNSELSEMARANRKQKG